MDPVNNPYTPGFGMIPPVLAGRDGVFADLAVLLKRAQLGRYDRPRLITGDRGYGKTVLVTELAVQAQSGGLTGVEALVVQVEAVANLALVDQLLVSMRDQLHRFSLNERVGEYARRGLAMLGAVSTRWGGQQLTLDVEPDLARGGDLVTDLTELLSDLDRVAREDDRAVLIAIDEVQQADATTFGAFAAALQALTRRAADPRDAPRLGVVLTGLPDARRHLRAAAGTYFADRIRSIELGPLDEAAAMEALDGPALELGIRWESDALDHAVKAADGYPYALQLVGESTWAAATGDSIDLAAVRRGARAAAAELASLFAARWQELPPSERDYLEAFVAVPADQRSASAVAAELGRPANEVATFRSRLVHERRLLRENDLGDLVFTLPHFDRWITQRTSTTGERP